MSDVRCRSARAVDLPGILQLLSSSDLPIVDLDENKLASFVVAETDGSLVGVVGLELFDASALLRSLAVASDQRSNGLGTKLLGLVETEAMKRGVSSLFLLTTTAASFFEAAGFERCDRRDVPPAIAGTGEFAHICPDSATCLRRSLQGHGSLRSGGV